MLPGGKSSLDVLEAREVPPHRGWYVRHRKSPVRVALSFAQIRPYGVVQLREVVLRQADLRRGLERRHDASLSSHFPLLSPVSRAEGGHCVRGSLRLAWLADLFSSADGEP